MKLRLLKEGNPAHIGGRWHLGLVTFPVGSICNVQFLEGEPDAEEALRYNIERGNFEIVEEEAK